MNENTWTIFTISVQCEINNSTYFGKYWCINALNENNIINDLICFNNHSINFFHCSTNGYLINVFPTGF